jgi:glycosyltransferase involved in cell wall biosynthesis
MKILFINDFGFRLGGGENYIMNIKYELEKRGHKTFFFSSNYNPNNENFISDKQCFSTSGKLNRFFKILNPDAFLKLKKIIKKFKPDVIHYHSILYYLSPYILLNSKKIPSVMTLHNYYFECCSGLKYFPNLELCKNSIGDICFKKKCVTKKEYFHQKLWRSIFNKFKKNIDIFIPCSTYGEKLSKLNNYKNVILLNHGVDTNNLNYLKIPKNNNILYLGRLEPEKGVNYLIESLVLIKEKFKDLKLFIVGEGSQKKNLEKITKKLNLNNIVEFVGKISNKNVKKYFQKSKILIVPSIWPENSPISIYESMSFGRPVIGSNIGGIPDLIDNTKTGYLIKPKNSKEISKKIIKLLSNDYLLEKMCKKSRIRAENLFSIDNHINKLIKIYEKAINIK